MTQQLVLALYAEGRTDERFLPIVIQRTAERLILQKSSRNVDVLEPSVLDGEIDEKYDKRTERVLEAARRAKGYHALIVHADADAPTPKQALQNRILPGMQAARNRNDTCPLLVPLVPVRMTEAWMLSDPDALKRVVGTNLKPEELGLPASPHQVESVKDPKDLLEQVVQNAWRSRRRRRRLKIGELYEPLAYLISLDRLRSVPSYRQFKNDLAKALTQLGFI